jgi:prepilin-type N-terminal cleavage/methylation domain-containing protein
MKKAFTLAEVLITLGVIGVVSALTIPTLVQNYKKQVTANKLKKFYSILSQAIIQSEAVNGPATGWEKGKQADVPSALKYYNDYLNSYIKSTKIISNSSNIAVYLADGSNFTVHIGLCPHFIYDTNGIENKPNEQGRDKFNFLVCDTTYIQACGNGKNPQVYEGIQGGYHTRKDALQNCKAHAYSCARLIMMDNWEIKDDYPYKL